MSEEAADKKEPEPNKEDEELEKLALALRRTIPGYTVEDSLKVARQIIEKQKNAPKRAEEHEPNEILMKAQSPDFNIAETTMTLKQIMDALIEEEEKKLMGKTSTHESDASAEKKETSSENKQGDTEKVNAPNEE